MSTTTQSYVQIVQDWERYLKAHPNNFIRIKDLAANRWINFEGQDRPSNLKWETVVPRHNTLVPFMDELIRSQNLSKILVQFKRTNGSGSKFDLERKQGHFDVSERVRALASGNSNINQDNVMEHPKSHTFHMDNVQTQPPATKNAQPNAYEVEVMRHMGGLGAAGLAAGMGFNDLLTLKQKAEQADFYKTELDRVRKRNDELEIDNRKLQSDVSTAEKEKEIAIKETKLAAKSWSDPDSIKAILENLGPVATQLINRSNAQQQQLGMGAADGLSESKKNFVGYLTDDMVTDERVRILEGVLVMMVQNKEFEAQLVQMINSINSNTDAAGS